jgi:YD repeat-containing protein
MLVAILALSISTSAYAQAGSVASESGVQQNRNYLALLPFESIDTSSGNVMLSFTDLELPGNGGHSLRFERFFSNGLGTIASDRRWRFSISGLPMRVWGLTTADDGVPGDSVILNMTYCPALLTPDGRVQRMVFMTPPSISTRWCMTPAFWKFDRVLRRLFVPDGTVADYDSAGRLVAIGDAFLNQTTLAYGTGSLTVRQALGQGQERVIELVMDGADDAKSMPLSMSVGGRTWAYEYQSGIPGALAKVTPPAGPPWAYVYDNRGEIQQVTTSSSGRVTYEYDWVDFPRADGGDPDKVHTLTTRRTYGAEREGVWQFAYPTNITGSTGTVVTLPSGAIVTHLYGKWGIDGSPSLTSRWVLYSRTVKANATAQPVEEESLTYTTQLKAARPDKDWYTNELSTRTIIRDGLTHTTEYVYDTQADTTLMNYHRPVRINETGNSGASRTRYLTHRHFTGAPYIIGLPDVERTEVAGETFIRSWAYYDDSGFVKSETRHGITTKYVPDDFGNVATATKGNEKWSSFGYSWGQIAQSSTPRVVTRREINPDGTVALETVAGRTTSFEYDALGRVTRVQRPGEDPVPNVTVTTYDNTSGQAITVTRGTSFTTTTLDGFGRAIRTENGVGIRTHTIYDAEGRTERQGYPYSNGVGQGDIGVTFTYDVLGRVERETTPDGKFRRHEYAGATETIFDEENRKTVLTRQAFGHPDEARLVSLSDAKSQPGDQPWAYQYNAVGSLTRVTAPDGTQRNWVYNSRNLLYTETHPESGTVTYNEYDDAGVLKKKTDAKGAVFTYGHDENDRLSTVTALGQTTTITYKSDSDERDTVSAGGVVTQFDYDSAGHLFSRRDSVDGKSFLSRFYYDANDNLKMVSYLTGRRIGYDYDGENRLTRVYNGHAPSSSYASGFTYHPSGALLSLFVGGKQTTYTYDPLRYWLTSHTVGADLQLTYSNYDGVGNVRTISDPRPNMTQTFTYDALDRLATANGPYGSDAFNYDVHGNRVGANYVYWANTFQLRSYDGGVTQMTYDNNGNLATGPSNTLFTYTPNNLMSTSTVGVNATSFTYDGDDWRVKKVVNGGVPTYFVRGPNGQLLSEYTANSPEAEVKDYIYAGGRLIAIATVEQ